MKYVVFLGDGMADYPIADLGGKTPLEVAKHPNMDKMASCGVFGMVQTIPEGMKPGSDTANLSVMGYDPKRYYTGRSPLEAASIGIPLMQTDVTYRCNFVTLSDAASIEEATMLDYSAGEISSEEARALVETINQRYFDETHHLYPGVSYRQCFVIKEAEDGALLTPPHDISKKPVRGKLPAGTNGSLLLEMMEYSYRTLKAHPINQKRIAAGKNPANCIWFWGEGRKPALTSFYEKFGLHGAVVSAVDLIQGIGVCAGMRVLHVDGATGNYHTNFTGKGEAAIQAFRDGCDFVYIHVEAPDECGHQGELREKIYSIEQIDEKIIGPVLSYLDGTGEAYQALALPDHPTPLSLMTHVGDPVPFALFNNALQARRRLLYDEVSARDTGVFVKEGPELMRMMLRK